MYCKTQISKCKWKLNHHYHDSSTIFHLFISVILMLSALFAYPLGLRSYFFRYYCGQEADIYNAAQCSMGWAYMLAVMGTSLSMFCPILWSFKNDKNESETEESIDRIWRWRATEDVQQNPYIPHFLWYYEYEYKAKWLIPKICFDFYTIDLYRGLIVLLFIYGYLSLSRSYFGIFSHFFYQKSHRKCKDERIIDWSTRMNQIVQIKLKLGRFLANCNTLAHFI